LKHRWTSQDDDQEFFKVILPTSTTTQWRTQAKLAVTSASSAWGSRDGCAFGLYERQSHRVTTIPHCQVHHPRINQAVELLQLATRKAKVVPFDEATGSGQLRYIQCQVERFKGEDKVCLTLVWNAEQYKQTQPTLSRLVKELKRMENLERQNGDDSFRWHSIWLHLNTSLGNAIFSRAANSWFLVDGPEFVKEEIPHEKSSDNAKNGLLYFTPNTFRQANMDGFEKIALHVAKAIPPGSSVCELYAGVGLLGLTALLYSHQHHGDSPIKWLKCSDENDANPRCFERAVQSMPTEITGREPRNFDSKFKGTKRKRQPRKEPTIADLLKGDVVNDSDNLDKVSYMASSASKALHEGQAVGASVIVVDPPRKGLEEDILLELCKPINPNQDDFSVMFEEDSSKINRCNEATTLIYVSCGFEALARDCERLLLAKDSGWKLESATGYILFPGTDHVETVAIFHRHGREQNISVKTPKRGRKNRK